ncbi:MAG: MFS transporter [Pontibacterium sp.]
MIESGSRLFWRSTLALCLGSFMIFANVYVTQPLLPMLASDFDISALEAGWSFTLTTLTLGLSLLVYGPLSDALGRKWLMVISMSGALLTTFMLSQAQSYESLLWLRALQGLCLGGLPAIAIAYMGDEFSKRALMVAVGLYISGNTLGGIGGRLIGGFVGEWLGWSNAFLVMTVISFFCLVAFSLLLPASSHFRAKKLHPVAMLSDLVSHLRNPLLLTAYLIGGFNFFIFINQYSYITFVLSDAPYQLPASLLGLLFLTYLTGTAGSALSGRIALYIPQPLVIAGGILILMGGSLITLLSHIEWIIIGFLVNSFGFFLAHSSASSWVSRTAIQARASASSLYLVFYYLGASTGGFYLDPFWQYAGWSGVVTGSVLVLLITLSATLWLYFRERDQARSLVV